MLYLGIDLHRKQMTVNLRGEDGEPIVRRQVSTWGDEPQKFLADVQRRAGSDGFVAILEVCGFPRLAGGTAAAVWLPRDRADPARRRKARARPTVATPTNSASCCGSTASGSWPAARCKDCGASCRPAARTRRSPTDATPLQHHGRLDPHDQPREVHLAAAQYRAALSHQRHANPEGQRRGSKRSYSPRSIVWRWISCCRAGRLGPAARSTRPPGCRAVRARSARGAAADHARCQSLHGIGAGLPHRRH